MFYCFYESLLMQRTLLGYLFASSSRYYIYVLRQIEKDIRLLKIKGYIFANLSQ